MALGFLQVALGGAFGAVMRYGVGLLVLRLAGQGFPLTTLFVNVVGSFVMGYVVVWINLRGAAHLAPLLMTGVLGGFTTFSAFSLEAVTLYERGLASQAALYVGLSVSLAIAGLIAGMWLARALLS